MSPPELLSCEHNPKPSLLEPNESDGLLSCRQSVSVVVPLYNERDCLAHLLNNLESLSDYCRDQYEFEFVFVDDGSTDGTADLMIEAVGHRDEFQLVFHRENRGIAAAIHTGIHAASNEIVVSIDADGSYDPHLMESMIPLLEDDVDMVTASPYHPDGMVENVNAWRLWISRCATAVYRSLMKQKLYCCTSCFRVYRRSQVVDLHPHNGCFVGVAEVLWKLDRQGSRIVEHPAVLRTRVAGASKMKVAKATFRHLKFIGSILLRRAA